MNKKGELSLHRMYEEVGVFLLEKSSKTFLLLSKKQFVSVYL